MKINRVCTKRVVALLACCFVSSVAKETSTAGPVKQASGTYAMQKSENAITTNAKSFLKKQEDAKSFFRLQRKTMTMVVLVVVFVVVAWCYIQHSNSEQRDTTYGTYDRYVSTMDDSEYVFGNGPGNEGAEGKIFADHEKAEQPYKAPEVYQSQQEQPPNMYGGSNASWLTYDYEQRESQDEITNPCYNDNGVDSFEQQQKDHEAAVRLLIARTGGYQGQHKQPPGVYGGGNAGTMHAHQQAQSQYEDDHYYNVGDLEREQTGPLGGLGGGYSSRQVNELVGDSNQQCPESDADLAYKLQVEETQPQNHDEPFYGGCYDFVAPGTQPTASLANVDKDARLAHQLQEEENQRQQQRWTDHEKARQFAAEDQGQHKQPPGVYGGSNASWSTYDHEQTQSQNEITNPCYNYNDVDNFGQQQKDYEAAVQLFIDQTEDQSQQFQPLGVYGGGNAWPTYAHQQPQSQIHGGQHPVAPNNDEHARQKQELEQDVEDLKTNLSRKTNACDSLRTDVNGQAEEIDNLRAQVAALKANSPQQNQ